MVEDHFQAVCVMVYLCNGIRTRLCNCGGDLDLHPVPGILKGFLYFSKSHKTQLFIIIIVSVVGVVIIIIRISNSN